MSVSAPRSASAHERAILNHPDQRTSWVAVMVASIAEPSAALPLRAAGRLQAMSVTHPILRSRWRSGRWHPGAAPELIIGDPTDLRSGPLIRRFALDREPPVRAVIDPEGRRLALAAHHAALDGRAAVAVIRGMLGQPIPAPPTAERSAVEPSSSLREPLRRLLRPADPVAPSRPAPDFEAFALREVTLRGPMTGRIAQACVAGAGAHNTRHGARWERIGLSVARGGTCAFGNVASYRRIDLLAGDRVAPAVHRALSTEEVPPEMVRSPRAMHLLAPLARRFSDSLLVTNLGMVDLPGVDQLALYPVVRGRSGVSFSAAEVEGGRATLCLRARDLSQSDADRLLDDALRHLEGRESRDQSVARSDETGVGA